MFHIGKPVSICEFLVVFRILLSFFREFIDLALNPILNFYLSNAWQIASEPNIRSLGF